MNNFLNQNGTEQEVISLEKLIEIEYALAGFSYSTTGNCNIGNEFQDCISDSLDIAYEYYSESEILEAYEKYQNKNKKNNSIGLPKFILII